MGVFCIYVHIITSSGKTEVVDTYQIKHGSYTGRLFLFTESIAFPEQTYTYLHRYIHDLLVEKPWNPCVAGGALDSPKKG